MLFDGVGGGDLVDGRHREDRFAGVEGLVRQRLLAGLIRARRRP